jgi:PHD/YefM family antitoxin component YafN of YafNO toxin-antitoxin module
MRSSNAVSKTISATEIRRRGLSAIDKALKHGPVHVLKNNEPVYVIMADAQYRELSERYRRSYINRIRQSLKDLKEGRTRKTTAQSLIDELGSEHMTRYTGSEPSPDQGATISKRSSKKKSPTAFSQAVGRALRRAAKVARKTARMHGTPIYVWENGKVVAKKP